VTGSAYTDLALYRRLLSEARPCRLHVAGIFALSLLSTPLSLLTPLPMMVIVDSVIGSRPIPGWLAGLLPAAAPGSLVLALMVELLIAVTLLTQLQKTGISLLHLYTNEKLVLRFRTRLLGHVQRLSLTYHDTKKVSKSLYRIQYDTQSIQNAVIEGVVPFVGAGVTLACMLFVMVGWTGSSPWSPWRSRRSSRCSCGLTACAPRPVAEVKRSRPRPVGGAGGARGPAGREGVRQGGARAGASSATPTKACAPAPARHRRERLSSVALTTAAGTAAVVWIGAHVRAGSLTLGTLLLVMAYLAGLYDPLKTISRKTTSLQSHLASAERAFSLLDRAPDVTKQPTTRPLLQASKTLAFREMSFTYDGRHPALRDVSFEIGAGKPVAVTGATGAGKTTLVSLLTRFYDPTAGRILLDGVDLRDYRVADLRDQFAIVLQEPVLLSTTIAENIAYAKPGASQAEIVAAARRPGPTISSSSFRTTTKPGSGARNAALRAASASVSRSPTPS
jgi:ATP-binding cassette subfamily B protein